MNFPLYYPLLDVYRSKYIDNRFFALAFLYNKSGLIKDFTGQKNSCCGAKFYLRSMFKPIQASILNEKIISKFNFNDKELAIMQASHSGEELHIEIVNSILNKIGLNEENLLCPKIPPLNTKNCRNITKLHNNCSGKHAMMLSYCVFNNLEISNYTDFSHPLQEKIREKMISYSNTNDFISTKDGCTVPIYGLEAGNIANLFLNYYSDKNNLKLIEAYSKNPYIIGGRDDFGFRCDTEIMQYSNNLISKVGAGGFIYVYNREKEEILIIKMAQDNNPQRRILALEILFRLNWLKKRFYDGKIYTEANEEIGEYVFNF